MHPIQSVKGACAIRKNGIRNEIIECLMSDTAERSVLRMAKMREKAEKYARTICKGAKGDQNQAIRGLIQASFEAGYREAMAQVFETVRKEVVDSHK